MPDSEATDKETVSQNLRDARRLVRKQRKADARELRGFRFRLFNIWREAFNLYDDLLVAVLQSAALHSEQAGDEAARQNDHACKVLRRLHARGLVVASEVRWLLAAGYASGAMARWRTLHEIHVIAAYLATQPESTTTAYVRHYHARLARVADDYAQQQDIIAPGNPLDPAIIDLHRSTRDALRGEYGKDYLDTFGWAASTLRINKPRLADLERATDLEHWRPWVNLANQSIHAGYQATEFDIGWPDDTAMQVVMVGPSDAGLADPFGCSAHSLVELTRLYVSYPHPTTTNRGMLVLLNELADELGEAAIAVHNNLIQGMSSNERESEDPSRPR